MKGVLRFLPTDKKNLFLRKEKNDKKSFGINPSNLMVCEQS